MSIPVRNLSCVSWLHGVSPPQTVADSTYRDWLGRFFALDQPLESSLRGFPQWHERDIDIAELGMTGALSCDLAALQCDVSSIQSASDGQIPNLANFPAALGSLYVLEGSKLGGRFILRDLAARLGAGIEGSDAFFSGNGSRINSHWTKFQTSLARFFTECPGDFDEAVSGFHATFTAVQQWMSSLHDSERGECRRSEPVFPGRSDLQ